MVSCILFDFGYFQDFAVCQVFIQIVLAFVNNNGAFSVRLLTYV